MGVVALLALLPSVAASQASPGASPLDYPAIRTQRHPKLDAGLAGLAARARGEDPSAVARQAPANRASSVAVRIHTSNGSAGLTGALAALGGVPANIGDGFIEAYVPVDRLEALADLTGVASVRPLVPPQPDLVTSQGAALHNTPNWNEFGVTGAGVKVGIIDVGFGFGTNTYTARQAAGEVPVPAAVRCYTGIGTFTANIADCQTSSQHGAAVAETIIDEAPGAILYLANPLSEADLFATAQWMAAQGVQVINHSVSWLWAGPGDGTSNFSLSPLHSVQAATDAGILWVNSAGNADQQTWTGPWADPTGNGFLDFAPGVEDQNIVLSAGTTVVLQMRWADDWGSPETDLDLLLFRSSTGTLVAVSVNDQAGGSYPDPFEFLFFTVPPGQGGTYRIRMPLFEGPEPPQVQLHVFNQVSNLSIQTQGHSIANPAESASPGMLAVGAAHWNENPGGIPDDNQAYSSEGPTTDLRIKPDLVAADCGANVTYGTFCGTSQAAPHVAGMAALLLERMPGLSHAEIADQLRAWSTDRGTPGPDNKWGAGFARLESIAGKLTFTQQPSGGAAGLALQTQPRVEVQDAAGVTDPSDDTTEVALSVIGPGTPSILCAGGQTATVVAGVAQFAGCSVSPPGLGYSLVATPDCACVIATSAPFDVSPPPDRLAFTTQPSHGITSTNLAVQPVVTVQDASGTAVVSDDSTQVTLSSVPAGVACSGGLQVTAVAGIAAFSGCQFASAGSYELHAASSPVLTPAESNALTITGPAAEMVFATQPTGAAAGASLAVQPIVTLRDASGATVVANSTTQVTLSLNAPSAGGPGVLTCSGGLTKSVTSGVASFTGCSVSAPGVGYSLRATSAPLPVEDSALFSLFGSATALEFLQQPGSGTSAQPFGTQPIIAVRDALGLTVTTDTSVITLGLVAGGGPGTLGCTAGLARSAVAGIATFSGCAIGAAGTYEIRATATNRAADDTGPFAVTGVGPATKLRFSQAPASGIAAQPLSPQPSVAVEDAAGALVTTDNTTSVTLNVQSGPGSLVCSGGNSKTAAAGIAVFAGCALSAPGTYILRATATGLTAADAASFLVFTNRGTEWYFAEGFTGFGWTTELHLLNPNPLPAAVTVTYLLDNGAPVARNVVVPAHRKLLLHANNLADGPGPDVAFGVHVSADIPIVVEEQMFAGASGDFAHGTQGATELSDDWYFAEGFTQFGWETFVLVANPGASAVSVTITYQVQGGAAEIRNVSVGAGARHTFAGHLDVPNQAFSVRVSADGPVVAEMAMYDPGRAIAHRAVGVTSAATSWYLGEGFTGFGWETFISVGNPGGADATVLATFAIDGESPVTKSILVPANSRGTFIAHDPATGVGIGKAFGVHITSAVPIVVQEVLIDPASGGSRANSTMASAALASQWSFSGGSSHAGLVTFLTVSNPGATPSTVTATYYFDDETAPVTQVIVVPAESRRTFSSADGIPADRQFGVVVTAVGGLVVAQEAVYDEPLARSFSGGGAPGP